jgi:hypothetical protein
MMTIRFSDSLKIGLLPVLALIFALSGWTGAIALDDPPGPNDPKKTAKLFRSNDLLTLEFTAPFDEIFRKRRGDRDQFPAKMVLVEGEKRTEFDVLLRLRGNSRADRQTCRFPPLKVEFNKEQVKKTLFAKQKDLKLVTHCRNDNDKYQQYYMNEYLIYRMHNVITPQSYGVRLASITYYDTGDTKPRAEAYGFFIERITNVGKRNGMEKVDDTKIDFNTLNPMATNRFMMFQYMVGNLDWSVISGHNDEEPCCHNARILRAADGTNVPVPFDFDQSGAVSAGYASSFVDFDVRNARVRVYRGFCNHHDALNDMMVHYLSKKADILAVLDDAPITHKSSGEKLRPYIEEFFETINNPTGSLPKSLNTCRE